MKTQDTKNRSRYPGVYSFETHQHDIFFGRENDIEKLLTLIKVENQVLLYSKSGFGKSSLLKAGIIPRLPQRIHALNIRFYTKNEEISPLQRIINSLKMQYPECFEKQNTLIDQLASKTDKQQNLWFFLKKLQFAKTDDTFLLVFDQFEELFSYPKQEIAELKEQLHNLQNNKMPEEVSLRIEDKLDNDPDFFDEKTFKLLHKGPEIKIVFAIRSDRLSLLNQLTDKLPDIQKSYYELQALNETQARRAITEPALKDGNFDSPKFEYESEAVKKIIDELTKKGAENVETTQLQIVCQRIEQNIIARRDARQCVSTDDIPDFKNIFFEFYNDAIKKVTQSHQPAARQLVEDELIRNKQRISLDGNLCTDILPDAELQKLVNAHLLRAERNTVGGFSYELSHDTLVEPIFEAAEKRRAKEEEQRAEAERQEELRKEREKQKQKRQRQIIAIVSIATILSIGLAVFGFVQMNIAVNTLNELTNEQYEKFMDNASRLKNDARYEEAIEMYSEAQKLIQNDAITDSVSVCTEKLKLKEPFLNNLQIIDSLMNKNEFEEALQLAEETKAMNYDQKTISETIKNIQKKAAIFYFKAAQQMHVLGIDKRAKDYLEKGLQFEPDNPYIIDFKQKNYPDE